MSTSTTEIPQETEDEQESDEDEVVKNEISEDEEEEETTESEIRKVDQKDIDESRETRQEEIDMDAEVETSSMPLTTEPSHGISGQIESENESGEGSNEDEGRSDGDNKEQELHHQSSTVKSDESIECDDGLRLDSDGKCVGKYY